MTSSVSISAQGRVSIPASIRRSLGLTPGTKLVTYVESGRVILETRAHLIERIQRSAASGRRTGESVVEHLIADRRRDASAEKRRTEG